MSRIYTPFALKLHAYGLGHLQDPNWTGMELFDSLKQHVRRRRKPYLLHEFAEQGVLYHLGLWLYDEFVNWDHRFEAQDCEDLSWYLEDLVAFLVAGGCAEPSRWIRRTQRVTNYFGSIYDGLDDTKYYEKLDGARSTLHRLHNELADMHSDIIADLAPLYAADYADRVFHDRQLCAFIAELLVAIGFNGAQHDDDTPQQWVERKSPPAWARKAVYARDRGKCANCSADIVMELDDNDHIDHIIPLARGGCNDLVNLQLLCQACNLVKSDGIALVTSSIPPYITRRVCK